MPLDAFSKSLTHDDNAKPLRPEQIVANLRAGLIGDRMKIETPFGQKRLIYADYTASGRALRQVEEFVTEQVLPLYANSHTSASHCGAYITGLREHGRRIINDQTHAGDDCSVIFSGSGATSAINRLVALSGISYYSGSPRPTVFIGPYEHHSNILPWRESGARVIEIGEDAAGGPDMEELRQQLEIHQDSPLLIGSFSAASNVSGILTDTDAVTGLLKSYGALAFWDYAGGAPYLSIDMSPKSGPQKDAIYLSPHKFPGGPGASGVLIVRNSAIRAKKPTWPGGGSVSYVSPWTHNYLDSVIEREEAGTPNIIGDIRAALVFIVKAAVGQDFINARDRELAHNALNAWQDNSNLQLLGVDKPNRLPIFSFAVRNNETRTEGSNGYVHHQLFTRLLSDVTGIQARGGCVCAGPYGHRLLKVERQLSEQIRDAVLAGSEVDKPGWVRLNFSYLMDDETAATIISEVDQLARNASDYIGQYQVDEKTANFTFRPETGQEFKTAV